VELEEVKKLYYLQGLSIKEIASHQKVSWDAVLYFMRKHKLARRSLKEASAKKFSHKPLSFKKKENLTLEEEKLCLAGVMLYWAEGAKSENYSIVDFANSDPAMVSMFMDFLRTIFQIDEKRLRLHLYCYADQNVESLVSFWCNLTKIPSSQLTKPYIRQDFRENGRKMTNGLIHVRYSDKKLWLEIMKMIEEYKLRYASIV